MKNIVGAGLSGLSAGINLALSGESVKIIDRSNKIASKFPESVHAFRNYSTREDELTHIKSIGLNLTDLKPIHRIVKYGPSLNPGEMYSEDKPLFYAVKRGNVKQGMDYQLHKQAEGLNINFELGTKNINSQKIDIIATGAAFATEMGYGYHYKNVNVDENTIIFLLNDKYAPKGYAYAIPYGKHEISVVTTSFEPNTFNKMSLFYNKLLEEVDIFSKLIEGGERGETFGKIGFYHLPRTAISKSSLITGEAAGFAEADRGFGMHYALESGALASKSIIENINYDELWKKSFEPELTKAFKRRLILNKIGNLEYDKLINAGTKMSNTEYIKYKDNESKNFLKQLFGNIYINNQIRRIKKSFEIDKFYADKFNI